MFRVLVPGPSKVLGWGSQRSFGRAARSANANCSPGVSLYGISPSAALNVPCPRSWTIKGVGLGISAIVWPSCKIGERKLLSGSKFIRYLPIRGIECSVSSFLDHQRCWVGDLSDRLAELQDRRTQTALRE